MGQITSSIGLISGLNTEDIIAQLIALESRPKTAIESRNKVLEAQQTAYQTVNASLLSLKNAGARISDPQSFSQTKASTSDDTVATVSSTAGAAVGNYAFTVRQLVGTQQTITRGYADKDATFIAPEGGVLTFNRGESRLDRKSLLSDLNGGQGIQRGQFRLSDRSGASTIIDLGSAVHVNDVVDAINRATGVNVTASIDGDRLVLTDVTGATTADLVVQEVGTGTTAASLGLVGSSATDTLTGTAINTVGKKTLIASLNDGNGLRTISGVPDINITTAGGGSYDLKLSGSATLEELADKIEADTGGEVTLDFNPDGTGLRLTDTTGGGAGFAVTAINDSKAGFDLGILGDDGDGDGDIVGTRIIASLNSKSISNLGGGSGLLGLGGEPFAKLETTTSLADLFQGTGITLTGGDDLEIVARDDETTTFGVDLDGAATVQDLINRVATATGGKVTASVEGQSIVLTDTTAGVGALIVRNKGNSTAATQLGIVFSGAAKTVTSSDLDPTGAQLTGTTISITNSSGVGGDVDLAGSYSIDDILKKINAAGLGVTATLSASGTGLMLTDTANGLGDLTIADGAGGVIASQLGLAGIYGEGVADSGPLDFQFVNEGTRLDNLGIARGQFEIQDSDGMTALVDLTQGNEQTIADVIAEINSRGVNIVARVNDSGDGILLEDTGSGAVGIKISEVGSTTARDLGILGDFAAGQSVDGSFKRTIDVAATDTLDSLALKIKNAKIGVNANVLNDGSPGAPFRLSLSSDTAGTGGAFTIDDAGLGFEASNLAEAQDAVVFVGGDNPATALAVTSRSNTLTGLIPGATVSLLATSDKPVQITVSDDTEAISTAVKDFSTSFNGLIDQMNTFDSYNAETEERGLLLGDSALARLRSSIYNAVIGRNTDLTGQFKSLAEVGLKVGSGAKLQFDAEKFEAAYLADPEAVRDLFTFEQFEVDPETGEDTEEVVAQGVGMELKKLLDRLTESTDGVLEKQVSIVKDQIELNKKRIEDVDAGIADKKARLEKQFADLESTLAKMQDQQGALAGLANAQAQR